MNLKKMITLIEILALTGVMSVGFSTWVIVETNFPEIQIQVETENVFNTNEYLKIKNVVFSDYDSDGFYNDFIYVDDNSSNKTGYLEFEIEVDLSKCAVFAGKLNFDISIDTFQDFSTSNIFLNKCSSSFRDVSIYTINDANNTTANINNSSISLTPSSGIMQDYFTITTSNVSNELTIYMKYGFTFSSMDDFINCTKDPFDSTKIIGIPFHISISLGGGN